MKTNLFIDGTWRPAADGRTFTFMEKKYLALEW